MITISPRKYRVTVADFPIAVEITAVNLTNNFAVVGSVREVVGGVLVARHTPVVSSPLPLVKTYAIDLPTNVPCDVTHHVDGWFPPDAPETARYVVKIVSANGTTAQSTLRMPSINPNFANFSFSF